MSLQAFKGKGEKYKLKWPERSEFIRMAAKFGATIVPFAGIGVEDSISIVADASEIQRIPIYGQQALQNAKNQMPTARRYDSDLLHISHDFHDSCLQRYNLQVKEFLTYVATLWWSSELLSESVTFMM